MIEVLDYWNRRWQSVRFDSVLGQGRVRWFGRRPKQSVGWAMYARGCWYALRQEQDGLVFQAGPKRWLMDDRLRCENTRRGMTRTFALIRDSVIVFRAEYAVPPDLDEATADRLDWETRDFFYWVATVWNDRKLSADLQRSWSAAALSRSSRGSNALS